MRYILPAVPAFALVAAHLFDDNLAAKRLARIREGFLRLCGLLPVLATTLCLAVLFFPHKTDFGTSGLSCFGLNGRTPSALVEIFPVAAGLPMGYLQKLHAMWYEMTLNMGIEQDRQEMRAGFPMEDFQRPMFGLLVHRGFVGKGVSMVARPSWSGMPWLPSGGIFAIRDQSWKLWLPLPLPTNPR